MNLRAIIDSAIHSGGAGSGCHGPNCGRPPGSSKTVSDEGKSDKPAKFTPRGQFSKEQMEHMQQKLKEKWMRKERKRLGLTESAKKAAKEAGNVIKEGGKLPVRTKQALQKMGQIINLKKGGIKLETKVSKVKETYEEKIKVGRKNVTVTVDVLKPKISKAEGPMGKTLGKNVPERMPGGPHKAWGDFQEIVKVDVKEQRVKEIGLPPEDVNRRSYVFDAYRGAPGAGTTVIVHKETSGNKSKVTLFDVTRSRYGFIEATKKYEFTSGKAVKDYLHERYGIKKIKWRG